MQSTYKIVTIGDAGVDDFIKFIKSHSHNSLEPSYNEELGITIYPVTLYTDFGLIHASVWDCSGQDKARVIDRDYYQEATGVICVCTNNMRWGFHIRDEVPKIPTIMCNKGKERYHKVVGDLEKLRIENLKSV